MGLRKKWAFNKIDWDEEIREGRVHVSPDDFRDLNRTEIVEILRLRGIRAHRGMPKDTLITLLQRGETTKIISPIDKKRDKLMAFLSEHSDKISDQMMPHCHGDCYAHHDLEVAVCYLTNAGLLNQESYSDDEEG